jgi:hypothetical protein
MQSTIIHFPGGHRARMVAPPAGADAGVILAALDIQRPDALIVISGGAGNLEASFMEQLARLFCDGIAPAALPLRAMIIDGGTHAGVMAMMGQGVAKLGGKPTLLGVAPGGRITYPGDPKHERAEKATQLDPHHSHFVLVQSDEWGGETETMFSLAQELARDSAVMTILVNGGAIAQNEVLQTVRRGWPLLVIEGSGRLADEIAGLWHGQDHNGADEKTREIIATGHISLFPLTGSSEALQQHIIQMLSRMAR